MNRRWGRDVVVVGRGRDADVAADHAAQQGAHVQRAADEQHALRVPVPDTMVVDEWTAEVAPHVVRARAGGAEVTVPSETILDAIGLPVVAVTGSAGKTTTSHLIAAILRSAGQRVAVSDARAGNAWPNHTLLDGRARGADVVVAELTSTHLCYMRGWGGASLAVLTALWPDHVELHGTVQAYEAAKRVLLDGADRVVLSADDSGLTAGESASWVVAARFRRDHPVTSGAWISDGDLVVDTGDGRRERIIAMNEAPAWLHPGSVVAAAAAGVALGMGPASIAGGIRHVDAIAHRMAHVGVWKGRELIDNSVCATPRKLIEALATCPPGRTVLVMGGHRIVAGREVHRSPREEADVARAVAAIGRTARVVVPFGPAAAAVRGLYAAAAPCPDLVSAIRVARDLSREGDTIIVAPMFPVSQDDRRDVARHLRGAERS